MTSNPETPDVSRTIQSLRLVTFLVTVGAALGCFFSPSHPLKALLLFASLLTTLLSLTCLLPVQNILSIAGVITLLSGVAEIMNGRIHFPYGNRLWVATPEMHITNFLPWPVPLIWIIAVLNSRGVARFLLWPRQASANFGLWILAATVLLSVVFDFGLERFARVHGLWSWPDNKVVPWSNFFGWGAITSLILVLAVPWLINKNPAPPPPPEYHPVILWFLLLALFVFSH